MPKKLTVKRRVTSGDIPNSELQEQRMSDLEMRRQVAWAVTLVAVGLVVFLAVCIAF